MALQSLVRWFLPKEEHFYDYLESQAGLCLEAANALATFTTGESAETVRDACQKVEHQADNFVRQMEDALARTFVTPLDREDLHKLTNELDDVVDLTNLAARSCTVYGVTKPTPEMVKLIHVLVQATAALKTAVPRLRRHAYGELIEAGRKIRDMEKEADRIFRAAITELFANPAIDAKELLKQKEVLDKTERAIDHCDNVADLLANLAVKHG
jgi:predicted phosphate transport protein (TIGR00153 family)